MQHTFAGLLPEEPHGHPVPQTRRSLLGRMMGFTASLAGIAWTRQSQAAQNVSAGATSMALGEEGGRPPSPSPKPPVQPRPTTLAVGEEGGGTVTTQAVGEEGGRTPSPPPKPPAKPRPTTLAVREEGGGTVTTQAVGEEGGRTPSPPPKPPAKPRPTTLAVREEGGGTSPKPSKPPATNGGATAPLEMLYGDLWLD